MVQLKGNAANVRLLDSSNFKSYKAGRRHRFYGGHAKKSPVRLPVPGTGHWHVVVNLGGRGGRVQSNAQVLPGELKPIQEQSLSSVPSLLQKERIATRGNGNNVVYDVFISHASEDRNEVVRPLADTLGVAGLRVWYDEFELNISDSLRQKIDRGLASSGFGVVVLSESFFGKGWTNYELDGIITRSVSGEQIMLPIWHNVTKAEVIEYSPSLADKLARSTTTHTVEEIGSEIAELILGQKNPLDDQ